jgi:molybdopterin converting factor small subunit
MTGKKLKCTGWGVDRMKIKVSYFAAFREATGTGSEILETTAATPAELFSECAALHSALQNYSSSLVAINDEMSAWEAALSEHDEVLFFPPVAGG